MRFEHDNYNLDIYSLCESTYYSCNNDEYDYVLECVNNWIYNNYNDNILLEDIILNELNYASLEKFAKAKGWKRSKNGEHFTNFDIMHNRPDEKNIDDSYDLERFESIRHRLAIRDAKRKGITNIFQLDNAAITGQEKERFLDSLGRSAEETDKSIKDMKKQSRYSRNWKHYTLEQILKKYGVYVNTITEKDLRQGGFFKHFTLSSLRNDNRDERNKAIKFIDDLYNAKYNKDQQSKSDNPLEEKKGKPAEVKPNTPPPQQPPSKPQSTVSNNNNNNNKSGLKTWHKAAIGAGAAAAVGAGIYAYKQYKNRPKSVIGKRIAALRSIYRKFMLNAQRNPQKAGIFKRIAAKILSVIDKLMGYLQNAAG